MRTSRGGLGLRRRGVYGRRSWEILLLSGGAGENGSDAGAFSFALGRRPEGAGCGVNRFDFVPKTEAVHAVGLRSDSKPVRMKTPSPMLEKSKEDVIELLESIARLLELKGENVFKIRAYTNAVRTLETFSGDFNALV